MNCNVLLMGLTGVGKSSLLNYLAGEELAEAGVTSGTGGLTRGINKYPVNINGQQCMVADTEGLEASHSQFWNDLMEKELLDPENNKKIDDWYHIVVYCIGANGGRVQDIELEMIRKLVDAGYGVIIALTKSDIASEDDIENIRAVIEKHFEDNPNASFRYVIICSKKGRYGDLEGKEKLAEAILDSWSDSFTNRLPDMVYDPIFIKLIDWKIKMHSWIEEQVDNMSLFDSVDDIKDNLKDIIDDKITKWSDKLEEKQEKAMNKVRKVFETLDIVIDTESLIEEMPYFNTYYSNLSTNYGLAIREGVSDILTQWGGIIAYFNPFLGLGAAAVGWISKIMGKDSRKEGLKDIFDKQLLQICLSFYKQKIVYSYWLKSLGGYIWGYKKLGICYLKGWGVNENIDKAKEYFDIVKEFIADNPDYKDGEFYYYLAYMQYLRGNKVKFEQRMNEAKDLEYYRAEFYFSEDNNYPNIEELEKAFDEFDDEEIIKIIKDEM